MDMSKTKKGVELSMNVVVIAILVILVLIFVALFFTGGFQGVVTKIRDIFNTQPITLGTIISECNGICTSYGLVPNEAAKTDYWNSFCTKDREADFDSNGKIDPGESKRCSELTTCPDINCNTQP